MRILVRAMFKGLNNNKYKYSQSKHWYCLIHSLASYCALEDSFEADNEDANDEEGIEDRTESVSSRKLVEFRWTKQFHRCLHRTWISDDQFLKWGDQQLLEGMEAVRLFKFVVISAISIIFLHEFVRWFDLEHDSEYGYSELILYDGPNILLDMITFFFLGRLHKQKIAVDHLSWVIILITASLYASLENTVTWLQHSFTLYEIHCQWPWQLFAFVAVLVPLSILIIVKHIQYAIQERVIFMKLIELSLGGLLFLGPQISHPNFHLHHWYVGWLLGMHCNFDTWWSRATMAWFWGLYVNGIAVYGRDPLQTCDYAFYISKDTRCSFLTCFMHQEIDEQNKTHDVYNKPYEVDWRNCSSR
jgi:hypothetical protein